MAELVNPLKRKVNFPVIFIAVVLLHLLMMFYRGLNLFTLSQFLRTQDSPTTLKIRRVKSHKVEHAHIKPMDSIFNQGALPAKTKAPVSLKDLAIGNGKLPLVTTPQARPGTRPEVITKTPRSMSAISLKSKEFKDFSKSFPSGGLAISNVVSGAQKISDAVVSIEVPDGVEPDELNEYELMFYSFQKRTSINYINSILKNIDKFQKRHPHYRLPSNAKISMTARLTYDSEGNVMQIKMVRWTHHEELQTLFEDIMKGLDQLHNPPKALWEKNGEFSMFYTLDIVNG